MGWSTVTVPLGRSRVTVPLGWSRVTVPLGRSWVTVPLGWSRVVVTHNNYGDVFTGNKQGVGSVFPGPVQSWKYVKNKRIRSLQGPIYSGSNRWAKYVCPFVLIVSRPCFLLLFCFVFAWFVFCFVSPFLRCQPILVMRSERGLQTAHRTNVIDRLVSARFRCVWGWGWGVKRKGVDTCTCSNRVTFWQQYCPHAQKAGRR